jgi:hypothetical protein
MSRLPARATQPPRRLSDILDPPDKKDLDDARSIDADPLRNKTDPYGGASEAREKPNPRQPRT